MNLCNKFSIELEFIKKVLGGIPVNSTDLERWFNDKNIDKDIREKILNFRKERDEKTDKNLKVFNWAKDESGIYVPSTHIKAHMRDKLLAMDVIKETNIRRKVSLACVVLPKKIRFIRDGRFVTNGHGYEKVKNNLHEYVEKESVIFFEIYVMCDSEIFTNDNIRKVFEMGQFGGFGSFRELYGNYKILSFEYTKDCLLNIEQLQEQEKC